jgi:hypothetical protein
MTTNNNSQLKMRWIGPQDVQSCVSLINQVFSINRSEAEYKWKFFESPPKAAKILITEDAQTNAIRAHYAVIPMFLNMSGETLLCCQSGDTAVHKDAEGKGLFVKSASEAFDTLAKEGYSCVYGFPNANSYPGFARRLGWARVGRLKSYRLRLKFKGIPLQLGRLPVLAYMLQKAKLANNALTQCTLHEGKVLPDGTDQLWEQIGPFEKFSIKKDKQYLEWRYSNNPSCKYEYFSLVSPAGLVALLIGRFESKRFVITELLVRKKDISIAAYLVKAIVQRMIFSSVADTIEFVGNDDGFFDVAFAPLKCSRSSLIFCLRPFGDQVIPYQIENSVNWTITMGDLDYL